MLDRAKEIIEIISKETREVVLMHSLTGKDSIALLDLLHPHFDRIVCVFMYIVPNLRHNLIYYNYAKSKYPKAEFIQVPHYAEFTYRKKGALGREGNKEQRQWRLTDIVDKVREKYGIEWACLGFKQSDSLNRRLMLRSYKDGKEAICWSGKKFYPLSTYKNGEVLNYIRTEHLKEPEIIDKKSQSGGDDITDPRLLEYLKKNFPDDLAKIYQKYPATRMIIENPQ